MSDVEVTDYLLRTIQPALSTVKGVGEAQILGGKTYSMRIWMDPVRMAAAKISAADIVNAIGSENYQSAAGQTRSDLVQTNVNAVTDTGDPEVLKRFVVRQSGDKTVRLGDVADIELGAEDYDSLVMFDAVPSIYIGINGFLDTVEVVEVPSFLTGLREFLNTTTGFSEIVNSTQKFTPEAEEILKKAIADYKASLV